MLYDLIVIGSGPGGYAAAVRASQLGLKTAVVEKGLLGGTCLNRGCIPTKTLMHTAELYRAAAMAADLGISIENISVDFARAQQRKDEVVDQLRSGTDRLLKANKIDLLIGQAVITGQHQVTIDGKTYDAGNILLAAGSYPTKPPIPGVDLPGVVTSDELLGEQRSFCNSLLIIGGGVIGVEIASVYQQLGCKVTIIEMMDRILPLMDREISQNMAMILKKRGIEIILSARVEKIEQTEQSLRCDFIYKQQQQSREAETILIATGRRPASAGLFAEGIEVEMNKGFIITDHRYQTSVEGIYAIGDVIGGPQLAHAAQAQGIAAAEYLAGKETASVDPNLVPACLYTSPEIATVGIGPDEAKQLGQEIIIGKYPMSGNAKSIIEKQDRGFIKLIFTAVDERIIGAQLMCGRATDLVSELTMAISAGLTRQQMLLTLHPHPTFSEGISEALEAADGRSLHVLPPRK